MKPCKYGHVLRGANGACLPCHRKADKKYRDSHPGQGLPRNRKWYAKNAEEQIERSLEYQYQDEEHAAQTRARTRKNTRRANGWAPGEHEKAEATRPHVTQCACCGSSSPRSKRGWQADHNHKTGMYRGYLCHPCNIIIGWIEKYGFEPNAQQKAYLKG